MDDLQIDEFHESTWVCPSCRSEELSQSMYDKPDAGGTYPWYCLRCGWKGSENELKEEEVAV